VDPHGTESLWLATAEPTSHPWLDDHVAVDVCRERRRHRRRHDGQQETRRSDACAVLVDNLQHIRVGRSLLMHVVPSQLPLGNRRADAVYADTLRDGQDQDDDTRRVTAAGGGAGHNRSHRLLPADMTRRKSTRKSARRAYGPPPAARQSVLYGSA
jgi:hypothetical protein